MSDEEKNPQQSVDEDTRRPHYIVSSWKGLERLWKAFWGNYFLGNFVIGRLGLGELALESDNLAISLVFLVLVASFLIWAVVSVWRCAKNTEYKILGYLARIIVIVGPIVSLYSA